LEKEGIIMAETKIYERTSESGKWVLHNNQILWQKTFQRGIFDLVLREYVSDKEIITYETPEQQGYKKQVEFFIVTYDEVPSLTKRKLKEKLFFKQRIVAKIKDDYPFMYITLNEHKQNICGELTSVNKFFIRDINKGITQLMSLNSSDFCKVEKDEPERCTPKEAVELSQKYNYVFDAVESDEGEETYRINLNKYVDNPM
jgi:hypothetical protein